MSGRVTLGVLTLGTVTGGLVGSAGSVGAPPMGGRVTGGVGIGVLTVGGEMGAATTDSGGLVAVPGAEAFGVLAVGGLDTGVLGEVAGVPWPLRWPGKARRAFDVCRPSWRGAYVAAAGATAG